MDLKEIKRLITLIEDANISHFSIEEDGAKIEIKKEFSNVPQTTAVVLPQTQAPPITPLSSEQNTSIELTKSNTNGLTPIKSQMVGTFYTASSPDSPPFIKIGDTIENGQVICVIEAMKLFNEIESETIGVIEEICVKNGEPVEFGQPLFLVR
jgi:acetyl-CoA carboxylase biotin carboxyl carrier protein